jgi:hypothetical protein
LSRSGSSSSTSTRWRCPIPSSAGCLYADNYNWSRPIS